MSLTVDIYDAFALKVAAFASGLSPALEVSYTGLQFDPPDAGDWLELDTFWNDSANYGWADDGPTVEQGFFRLTACTRSTTGLNGVQGIAEDILAEFAKGTTFGGARVERAPTIGGPIQHDDRLEVPVTIRWRATRT